MAGFSLKLAGEVESPFEVTYIDLLNPELPDAFNGYRLVQLSDFHFGRCTTKEHIQHAIDIARSLNPNVLLLTGDLIQYSGTGIRHILATRFSPALFGWIAYRRHVRILAQEFSGILAQKPFTDGIIGVFGNHDYHEGIGTIKRQLGDQLEWLKNSATIIRHQDSQIAIAGIDDYRHGKPSIKRTLQHAEELGPSCFKLFLTHNPDITLLAHADQLSKVDLVLCGHTHGGQICLPGRLPILSRTAQRKHTSGLSLLNSAPSSTPIYVSRGVGYGGLPWRFFCPPEIVVLTLKKY